MELTDDLKTGIPAVDEQQEKFLSALEKLYKAFKEKLSDDELQGYIVFLEVYAKLHFSAEEYYMSLYEYPDIENHMNEHLRFKLGIENLKLDVSNCNKDVINRVEVSEFMVRWFVRHIKNTDKKFAKFLKENDLEFKEGIPVAPSLNGLFFQ